jgi:plastocyanin
VFATGVRAEFLELWDNVVPRDTPPVQVEALKEESRALSRRLTTSSSSLHSRTEGAIAREHISSSPARAMMRISPTERVAAATTTVSLDCAAVSPSCVGGMATELQATTTTPDTAAAAAVAAPTRRVRVTVEERTFRPATLRVPVGTLVEWVCGRSVKMAHVLALGLDDDNLESIPIAPGKPPFTWLFTDPGVFAYHSQVCFARA